MKINKITAFTFAELMLTLFISVSLSIMLIGVFKGAREYIEKIKLKNINIEFKNGIDNVIRSPKYYPGDTDLSNTEEVEKYSGVNKFRSVLLNELGIQELNPVYCYILEGNKNISKSTCYRGGNNVIWGIPDTDFKTINVVEASNASGSIYKYVPVTIYPDPDKISSVDYFKRFAIVYGVRRDGDITIINNVDCSDYKYKEYNQCKCKEAITSK